MVKVMTDLASTGATRDEMAKEMGISRAKLGWMIIGDEFPEVRAAYMAAKQVWANDLAESIIRKAEAPLPEDAQMASAEVQRRRLVIDSSKWIAARLLPKVYGDNLVIDHKHSGEVVISPLAQLRALEGDKARTIVLADDTGATQEPLKRVSAPTKGKVDKVDNG
tara:strand:- start:362 stop:856 length:495 start_codon:yes stop_codon:yes gene_type:complete